MGSIPEIPKLFSPLKVGNIQLNHRVVMSPLTRARSCGGIPSALVAEYYAQRATPGGLIITEGTLVSYMAGNLLDVPGIYMPEHIRAWRAVTNAVHAKGAFVFCQLWHTGRFAVSSQLGGRQPLSASATNAGQANRFTSQGRVPNETAKEMTLGDIAITISDFVHASKCAIEAGFDGVEITAGNGWLPDQFLNSATNLRTDKYGGSIENRARFTLETLNAVIEAVGASRTSIRFSPFGLFLMPLDSDPIATFSYVLSAIESLGLAYVSLTQPRTDMMVAEKEKWKLLLSSIDSGETALKVNDISLNPLTCLLQTTPKFASGNYDEKNCFNEVEDGILDAVTFGRWFISNPDLVQKLKKGLPLKPYNSETFYSDGPEGYTDYPAHHQELNVGIE